MEAPRQYDSYVFVKPAEERLTKYISDYYFISSEQNDCIREYVFYPNYRKGITIYKNSKTTWNQNESCTSPSEEEQINIYLTSFFKNQNKVTQVGKFNKIGIEFNELGLNHFIQAPTDEIFKEGISQFNYFGEEFLEILEHVFSKNKMEEKIEILDTFFLSRLITEIDSRVTKAVDLIHESNGKCTIKALSATTCLHRKTLYTLFKRYVGCSIQDYQKVVRFRNALNNFNNETPTTSLTELAHQSLYFDQSHFTRNISKMTGELPKSFFTDLTELTDGMIWKFRAKQFES